MNISALQVRELRERSGGAGMMDCKKALVESKGNIEAALEFLRKSGIAKASKKANRIAAEGVIIVKSNENNKLAVITEVNCETDFVAKDVDFNQFADEVVALALNSKCGDLNTLHTLTIRGKTIEDHRKELIAKLGENIQIRRLQMLQTQDGMISQYRHGIRIGVLVNIKNGNSELGKDIAMHIAATHPQAILPDDVPNSVIDKEREIFKAQSENSGKPTDIIEKMVEGRVKKFLKEVSLIEQPFVKDPNQTIKQLLQSSRAEVKQFVRFEVGEGIEKQTEDFAKQVADLLNNE